jgi:hypothetical protein
VQITAGVAIVPAAVTTAVMWPPAAWIPVTGQFGMIRAPSRRAAVA